MTVIEDVVARSVRIPLTRVFSTSNKTSHDSRLLMVAVRTSDGLVGWGEAALNPTFTRETMEDAKRTVASIGSTQLVGRAAEDAFALVPRLSHTLGRQVAVRMALTTALHDLRARALGLPLHVLLGGRYRTTVPTTYHLGSFDAELDAQDAVEAVEQGFEILKLKVGRTDVKDDVAAVRRIRDMVGDRGRVYADANQAWSREQAEVFLAHADELGVAVVEQPTAADDLQTLSELGKREDETVVAADESIHEPADLVSALAGGCAPAGVVVKLLKAGGLDGARDIMRLAVIGRSKAFLAGMPGDSSISSAALLNLAVATPDLPLGTAITPHLSAKDVTRTPLQVRDGHMRLEDLEGPGLGITVDPSLVDALAED